MPAIKARKITASNMTTPVDIQQRTWNGVAYVWTTVQRSVFCEFQSKTTQSVGTGMSTIGATRHIIYTRFQQGIQTGMRLVNNVAGTLLYVHGVVDVEQVHQWLEVTAVETVYDRTVQIIRPTTGKGLYRQQTTTETVVATVQAVFAEPNASVLANIADRIGSLNYWAVGVPEDTNVNDGDILQIVDTGERFKIHAVRKPMSFMPSLALLVGEVS